MNDKNIPTTFETEPAECVCSTWIERSDDKPGKHRYRCAVRVLGKHFDGIGKTPAEYHGLRREP